LLVLETAMQHKPKDVKKLMELDPTLLQHPAVMELVGRYKKSRKRKKDE
jgi:hypothetical protein